MFVAQLPFRCHILNPNQGRRYLLRLINTSVDTTFVFTIDNHWLKVIAADFVPIHPYVVDHVVVGIGRITNLRAVELLN